MEDERKANNLYGRNFSSRSDLDMILKARHTIIHIL